MSNTMTMREMATLRRRAERLLERAGTGEYRLHGDTERELLRICAMPLQHDDLFLTSFEIMLAGRPASRIGQSPDTGN